MNQKAGAIIGVVIVVLGLIGSITYFCWCKQRVKKESKKRMDELAKITRVGTRAGIGGRDVERGGF